MIQKILNLGIKKTFSHGEIREAESLNLSLAVGAFFGIVGIILFLPVYFYPIVLFFPCSYLLLILFCFWLSSHSKHKKGRIIFWIFSIGFVVAIVLISVPESLVNMYLILLMVGSFQIFPYREIKISIGCGVVCALFFLFFFFSGVGGYGIKELVPSEDIFVARVSNVSITIFALALFGFSLSRGYAKMTESLATEKDKSDLLLRNVLPEPIIDKLNKNQKYIAERSEHVAVFFADISGFTQYCNHASPEEVVHTLNKIFTLFDRIGLKYGVEKIKTIGDSYMAVVGTPIPHSEPEIALARFALEILSSFKNEIGNSLGIRIGLHTGPVVAGIIGERRFSYDLWGATVNIASRLESHGEVGRIHISNQFRENCSEKFHFIERGFLEMKGLGKQETFFLES